MQRLVYPIIYSILWLTSILPMWLLYLKSDFLFIITYYVVGYRRDVVNSNLKLVFPEKTNQERKDIARKFYRHLCDIIFETIKILTISEKEMMRRFKYENLEILDTIYKKNRSILLLCGHYASWEWSAILTRQMKFKGFGVYKKIKNPSFDTLVRKIRGRFGAEIISNKKVVSFLFRHSRKNINSLTLMVADQTPKAGAFKHRDTFMGVDVPIFTGTEELAKKLDFVTMYLKITKIKRGYYRASLEVLAEHPSEFEDFQITRLFLDALENQIREKPQYYLWSHKRWKLRN